MGRGPEGRTFFEWDDFQNRFFQDGGWKEALNGMPGTIPWVDRYVKDILAELTPKGAAVHELVEQESKTTRTKGIACSLFEMHRALLVRIRLTQDADPAAIRLYASPNELVVAGLPDGEEREVRLPVPVRTDGAKAICKNGIVEVSLQKEGSLPRKEIRIRHLDE